MSALQHIHRSKKYSQLFRPWDSNCSQNADDIFGKVRSAEIIKESILNNKKFDKKVFQSESIPNYSIDAIATYPSFENGSSLLSDVTGDIYFTNALQAPLYGIDPVSINLMEQEYARVIAEDAQIKAMNAKKQRPKKFKCPHCNVAFSNNGQLKGHIRIHTGERPFKCDADNCGKTFTRNEELTRHKRIHTGLRPFVCTICGKKFGRRDHLKKHTKTHIPQERHLGPAMFVPIYPYLYGF